MCGREDLHVTHEERVGDMTDHSTQPTEEDKLASWGEDTAGQPILPSTRPERRTAPVDVFVVQVADFVGPPATSPFAAIVTNCGFSVCESKVMKAAVDFKWQRTSWWIKFDLTLYVMSLVVASGAVLGTAWEISHPWEQYAVTITDSLIVAMVGLEMWLLVFEAAQIVSVSLRDLTVLMRAECMQCRQAVLRSDWLTLWNVIDLLAILLLLTTAAVYLVDHALLTDAAEDAAWRLLANRVLQNIGSVGVAVKWLGLLEYLSSFQYFGKTLEVRWNSWAGSHPLMARLCKIR